MPIIYIFGTIETNYYIDVNNRIDYNSDEVIRLIINKLSEVMGRKRLKIQDVVNMTGMTRNTVADLYYDKSKMIAFETMDRLCKALDVQPGELFTYQADEE